MRGTLAKKDDTEPEEIKRQTNELQQASLKLFEMAYKKVCNLLKFIWNFNAHFSLFFNNLYNPCFLKYLGLIVSLLYSEYDKHYLRNN